MWRYSLYLFPVLLLLGAGCVIGNSVDSPDFEPDINAELAGGTILAGSDGAGDFNDTPMGGAPELLPLADNVSDSPSELSDELLFIEGEEVGLDPDDVDPENLPETQVIQMRSGNFFFEPTLITAAPGSVVQVQIAENRGLHTFVIDELGLRQQITEGSGFQFVVPQEPGDYMFYCDIGEHRALGMEGVLRVE